MTDDAQIDDKVDLGIAFTLMGRDKSKPAPYATCPTDGEPLISTMETPGAEFLCMVCGRRLGFLSPSPAEPTPELEARYAELKAKFKAGERP